MRRNGRHSGLRSTQPGRSQQKRRDDGRERWGAGDILIMVLAALRVMLPFVLILLLAILAAYGLFVLAFG